MFEIMMTGGMSTVQDSGRQGYRRVGVGVSGPMDALAAQVGNAMLLNESSSAFVEIALFPFVAKFSRACRIAITGTDARARLDDRPLLPWWSVKVNAGQQLRLEGSAQGGIAYLCVGGGIDVPPILNSRCTDLKGGFGGYQGRPLRKADKVSCLRDLHLEHYGSGRGFGVIPPCWAGLESSKSFSTDAPIRVIPSGEWDEFTPESRQRFVEAEWKVSPASNRIGSRLEGPVLSLSRPIEMLSYGVIPGLIQVPPSGLPIVMQCDAQTAGGYPKIATVIDADQGRVAQTPPGGVLRFELTTPQEAQQIYLRQQKYVEHIRHSARFKH